VSPDATQTAAIILAAGLGTRMRSSLPKVLHPVCGRPMLGYVIEAARTALGSRPVVVYSEASKAVRDVFANEAAFARQDPPNGTGDAVRVALAEVDARCERDPGPERRLPAPDRGVDRAARGDAPARGRSDHHLDDAPGRPDALRPSRA
jgi:hypothetical protein